MDKIRKIRKGVFDLDLFDKDVLVKMLNQTYQKQLIGNLFNDKNNIVSLNEATHIVNSVKVVGGKLEVECFELETEFSKNVFKFYEIFDLVPRFFNGEFITFDIKPVR